MTIHYLTIFDRNYLTPALAQYHQLRKVSESPFHFYTLDNTAAENLSRLELTGATVHTPFEFIPEEIMARKEEWSNGAFAFMNKSAAIQHVMAVNGAVSWAVFLDVDVGVFEKPETLLSGLAHNISVQLTPHRFTPKFQHFEADAGRFNAGYVAFRNTEDGKKVLNRWRELCLEWCHDYVDGKRFGDQKYLEVLADQFPSVSACSHPGANAAPWNISDKIISLKDGQPHVAGEHLVFYHFQGLKQYSRTLTHLYASREMIVSNSLLNYVYKPYVTSLIKSADYLEARLGVRPVYAKRTLKFRIYEFLMQIKGLPDNYYRIQ